MSGNAETIFEALRESHQIQRSLMRKVLLSRPGDHRDHVFRALCIELGAHEAAEERYLYCDMLMDDRGLHSSRDALADHHKMDDIVEELQGTDHGRRGWIATARKLSKELHEHLREEEKIFFQLAGKILSDTKKTQLAKKYRRNYLQMHRKLEQEFAS